MKFARIQGFRFYAKRTGRFTLLEREHVFEKSVRSREGAKIVFCFLRGTTFGKWIAWYHHVMARTNKGYFPSRYKTMKGFQVKRKGRLGYSMDFL